MAIYDIAGNELSYAYSLDGEQLSEAYDIDGNALYEDEPVITDDIDLSNVESYFVPQVQDAMAYVKSLGVRDWVHHLLTTDTHYYQANQNHAVPIIEAMQTSGYFGKVIQLGDIAHSGNEADYTKAVSEYGRFNGNLLFSLGNHDVLFDNFTQYWVNNLLSQSTDITDPSTLDYYYDDAKHKIRYIVYNSQTRSRFSDVKTWLKSVSKGWGVIILSHYAGMAFISDWSGTDKSTSHPTSGNITDIEPYLLMNKDINFIGWFAGHQHTEAMDKKPPFNFINQIVFLNDSMSNDSAFWHKVEGTNTEQAVSIVSINTKTKRVQVYRIGQTARFGRQFGYNYSENVFKDEWAQGYYVHPTGFVTASNDYFMYLTPLPAKDANGNAITYQVYSKDGTPLKWIYKLAFDSNINQTRCSGDAIRGGVHSFTGSGGGMGSNAAQNLTPNCDKFIISVQFETETVSPNDVVISTTPCDMAERVGSAFSSVVWEDDTSMSSAWATTATEGTATSGYIKVDAGSQYRLYVDDTGYTQTNPWARIYAYDNWFITANTLLTQSSGGGNTLPFTFTIPSDCHLIRISLGELTGYTDKVRLEKI